MSETVFLHFDIEADGPTPMTSNMLELGICATNENGDVVAVFHRILKKRPGVEGAQRTIEWLKSVPSQEPERFPSIYDRLMTIETRMEPAEAMRQLKMWVEHIFAGKVVKWVAYPAAFDWMFIRSYWDMFLNGDESCGYSAICLSTLVNNFYQNFGKFIPLPMQEGHSSGYLTFDEFKKSLQDPKFPLTHNALDDAIHQAKMYHNLLSIYIKPLSEIHNNLVTTAVQRFSEN